MVFGIDLGTTNSLIGTGDRLLTGLVPSVVNMENRECVSKDTIGKYIYRSYKTNITVGKSGENAVICSSVVLKNLAETATRRYGEKVEDVVISVPAYFSTSQREAVYKAAELAGLNVRSLINEPTAAAIYTCKDESGLVVVYDLGGGTFDVSVVDNRAGICSVVATDGIVLGGDDLDKAIVEDIIQTCKIPVRYRNSEGLGKLGFIARTLKEEIQRTRNTAYARVDSIGIDKEYSLSVDKYKELVEKVFGRTFDMFEYIIHNKIPETEKIKVVFVGGSSNCPYLREMLHKRLEFEEISCDINPDLVVAKGVALYAEMLYENKVQEYIEDVTKQLSVESRGGKCIPIIESNTVIPCSGTCILSNQTKDERLLLKLYQGSSIMASRNEYIGTLVYEYGEVKEVDAGVVEVTVTVDRDGIVKLEARDILSYSPPQSIELSAR